MVLNMLFPKARSAVVRLRRNVISARFGASPDQIYGDMFYGGGGFAATDDTADVMVPYLLQRFAPQSVLDPGCGMGNYLKLFANAECRVVGLEGSVAGLRRMPDSILAMRHDLRKPLVINQRFDLVMSIEVAEHIPKKHSRTLVGSLCAHSKGLVLFTAAPLGTPGDDHINCRERPFFDRVFLERGFELDQEESRQMMNFAAPLVSRVGFRSGPISMSLGSAVVGWPGPLSRVGPA